MRINCVHYRSKNVDNRDLLMVAVKIKREEKMTEERTAGL